MGEHWGVIRRPNFIFTNLVKVEDDVTKEGHEDKNLDGEQEVVLENIQINNHFWSLHQTKL